MSLQSCEVCSAPWVTDEDGIEDQNCNCVFCDECGKGFRPDDEDGPSFAASDDYAEVYGEQVRCQPCWVKALASEL